MSMTRYLISFDEGAMTFPAEDLPDVAKAARAVVDEAEAAGVWILGAGVQDPEPTVVAADGSVTSGLFPAGKAWRCDRTRAPAPDQRSVTTTLPRT
jgi:hypothetical protein